ncbi:DUF1330 domain-containing protein [Micromonospora sp. NPDC049559]|uniref:DUF1330 domain-containing protein n=1 Tax=Micromonospora sp. NPDC049559 TaxID=3155923 RepID=UPI003430A7E4
MATYLINHLRLPGGVPNEAFLSYLEQVEATVEAHGGRFLANGEGTVVEGAWTGLVVLLEFPDRAAVSAWSSSEEYQRIRSLRVNNAISDVVLLDSLPSGHSMRDFAQQTRAALAAPSAAR